MTREMGFIALVKRSLFNVGMSIRSRNSERTIYFLP